MTTYSHDATEPVTEPDDATVEQEEVAPSLTCIPVVVEGPVRIQELPAKAAGYRRVVASTTEPKKVLGRDPRRRRMVLQVYDAAGATHGVFYGASRTEVAPGDNGAAPPYAARLGVTLPAGGVPVASPLLELTGMDELWVLADTAVCDLSIAAEQWAD